MRHLGPIRDRFRERVAPLAEKRAVPDDRNPAGGRLGRHRLDRPRPGGIRRPRGGGPEEGRMRYHYVWLAWSGAFLLLWVGIYLANPGHRKVMWRTSLATALLGLTEPIYVPRYWNPPSLFELAQRTGFDIESLIFAFAIGGIGSALYDTLTRRDLAPVNTAERHSTRHRVHRLALLAPYLLFVPLYFLPWNPIYPSLLCLLVGAIVSVICRPDLRRKTLIGGLLFLGLYTAFMLGLQWLSPGY